MSYKVSKKEEAMMKLYILQKNDAKYYFLNYLKPQYDRAYKLYMAYNGDRAKELKKLDQTWRANVFVPYINSVVETLMPRILDARPEFTVQGRNEDDQLKSEKLQNLCDYTWELSSMDDASEMLTRSALIYGTGFLQVGWKKDVRTHKFLETRDLLKKKYEWKDKEQVFYDAPCAEYVDNYSLWYDWHNIHRKSKQYWFKRLILTEEEITRRYPMHDKKRLAKAIEGGSGVLDDYASIRGEIKKTHTGINKGDDYNSSSGGQDIYKVNNSDYKLFEVFEWWRPFADEFAVIVGGNDVPILKGGSMPIPYDFKETTFIEFPYLKLPHEFEGVGLPMLLENPQIMLNLIKNQRLDATTLGIHKMWIVNPLANVNKEQLVVRPFGIVFSPDPQGVREVQFSDIKASAYKEEELLKGDMRYASGVDDFSMGVGSGGSASATEVRHLRESTLERVRLFVNHLGDGYSVLMRYWISMYRQFFTKELIIRITGDSGEKEFSLIEKDDLKGEYDYVASVIPSIAGKNDIDKKQSMDLFQLLAPMPFIDQRKLTGRLLKSWDWSLDSVAQTTEGQNDIPDGSEIPPEVMEQVGMSAGVEQSQGLPDVGSGEVPIEVIKKAVALLGKGKQNGFKEASSPINLLQSGGLPPTVASVGKTTNPRGLNRGGKVNTNIPVNSSYAEGNMYNQANNLQR